MFETTRDFFSDAFHRKLEDTRMLDIMLCLTGFGHHIPQGQLMHDFHKLTPKQRNYICCVLLERDQDALGWEHEWSKLESESFE
jgi:hypothetical protein